jgi:hypothetical protein
MRGWMGCLRMASGRSATLLDLDAALGGGDEHVAPGVAVGGDGEVVLVAMSTPAATSRAW